MSHDELSCVCTMFMFAFLWQLAGDRIWLLREMGCYRRRALDDVLCRVVVSIRQESQVFFVVPSNYEAVEHLLNVCSYCYWFFPEAD